jgi:hypothetical protein
MNGNEKRNEDSELMELKKFIKSGYRDETMTRKEWVIEHYLHESFNFPIKIKKIDETTKIPTKRD